MDALTANSPRLASVDPSVAPKARSTGFRMATRPVDPPGSANVVLRGQDTEAELPTWAAEQTRKIAART